MAADKWNDLRTRAITGVALAVAGIGAVILGGHWTIGLCVLAGGVMVWELAAMLRGGSAGRSIAAGVLAGLSVLAFGYAPGFMAVALYLSAIVLAASDLSGRNRWLMIGYSLLIGAGLAGFLELRLGAGMRPVLWLVLVVVASDLGGYFGGRLLGGPKFWERVSPKKTWSGTIVGWILAACVAVALSAWAASLGTAIVLAVLLAFTAQLGDIAESAIKRFSGVKDSSAILPGHGGVLDRFDAMLATFALAWPLSTQIAGFPGLG